MRVEYDGVHTLVAKFLLDGADDLAWFQQVFHAPWPPRHIQAVPDSRHVVEIPGASDLGLRTPDNELQGRPLDRSEALATCGIGCARVMFALHDRNNGGSLRCAFATRYHVLTDGQPY